MTPDSYTEERKSEGEVGERILAFISELRHRLFLLLLFLYLIKSLLDIIRSLEKFYHAPKRTCKAHLVSGLNLSHSPFFHSLREFVSFELWKIS